MGCAPSTLEQEQRTKALDMKLEQDYKEARDAVKVLLLGTSGCGKSTIIKQMKRICENTMRPVEIKEYTVTIRDNLLSALKQIATAAMHQFGYDDELKKDILGIANKFAEWSPTVIANHASKGMEGKELKELSTEVSKFMADPVIQKTISRGNEYCLLDSASYYIKEVGVPAIMATDFAPTFQHIVRSRKATESINEMIDVGGQRGRRKQWIKCFDNVTIIFFIASLEEYDMMLEECATRSRMHESHDFFNELINLEFLDGIPIVLLLNKVDILREKIAAKPFVFEDFEGDGKSEDDVLDFVKNYYIDKHDMKVRKTTAITAMDFYSSEIIWTETLNAVLQYNRDAVGMMDY
eukprot:jgi/Bigna1/90824/estExt_fgenesh1_pg.C_800066